MSFGAAASGASPGDAFVAVRDEQPCPCGSGDRFDGCCGPLLRGGAAPSARTSDALALHGVRRRRCPLPFGDMASRHAAG